MNIIEGIKNDGLWPKNLKFLTKTGGTVNPEQRSHSETNEVRHQKWMPQANHLQVAGRVLTL